MVGNNYYIDRWMCGTCVNRIRPALLPPPLPADVHEPVVDAALAHVDGLVVQLNVELSEFITRPTTLTLTQRKAKRDAPLRELKRTKGDLLIVRGPSLVLAELKLARLLEALDGTAPSYEYNGGGGRVLCTDPAVCAFFSLMTPDEAPFTRIRFDYKLRQGRRDYYLEKDIHYDRVWTTSSVPRADQAQRLLDDDLRDARRYLESAKAVLAGLPAKRKRVEEYEARWAKRARVEVEDA